MKKLLASGLLVIGALSCSMDKSDSDGKKSNKNRIDTSGFKNTEDKKGFNAKAETVYSYSNDSEEISEGFLGASSDSRDVSHIETVTEEICDWQYVGSEQREIDGEVYLFRMYSCEFQEDGDDVQCRKEEFESANGAGSSVSCTRNGEPYGPEPRGPSGSAPGPDVDFNAWSDFSLPMTMPSNCGEAFDSFDQLYAQMSQTVRQSIDALNETGELGLAESKGLDGIKLTKEDPDDKSAVRYSYSSEGLEFVDISGSISGGANDEMLLISQEYNLSADMGAASHESDRNSEAVDVKIEIDQTVAADLIAKQVERVIKGKFVMVGDEVAIDGRVFVSAGDEKYVQWDVAQKLSSGRDSVGIKVVAEAKLVRENLITFEVKMDSPDSKDSYRYSIAKIGNRCEITEGF